MQIILVQQEVEQALRDYVARRLTLVEGTTFEVDLAATRGANGFTATINLVQPSQNVTQAAAITQATSRTLPAPTGNRKSTPEAPTKTQETPVTAQPDPNVSETPVAEPESPAPVTETSDPVVGDPNQADPNVAQAAEVNTAQPKSLFAGLQRPKNTTE